VEHELRVERVGALLRLIGHDLPPTRDLVLEVLAPGAVLLAPQKRSLLSAREIDLLSPSETMPIALAPAASTRSRSRW